jgi:hypothetical protein
MGRSALAGRFLGLEMTGRAADAKSPRRRPVGPRRRRCGSPMAAPITRDSRCSLSQVSSHPRKRSSWNWRSAVSFKGSRSKSRDAGLQAGRSSAPPIPNWPKEGRAVHRKHPMRLPLGCGVMPFGRHAREFLSNAEDHISSLHGLRRHRLRSISAGVLDGPSPESADPRTPAK